MRFTGGFEERLCGGFAMRTSGGFHANTHHARLMMIRDRQTAATAAARVGYESPSQFSREFKRFFGRSPAEKTRCMAELFALLPATQEAHAEQMMRVKF